MKKRLGTWLLVGVVVASAVSPAGLSLGDSTVLVGSWSVPLLLTPDGRGGGESVHIARVGGAWQVSFTKTSYHGTSTPPKSTRLGPFDAIVDSTTIRIRVKDDWNEYTYRLDGDTLVLPALVRMDERTWIIRGPDLWPNHDVTFRCEHDPFEVPVGKAEFPSVQYEGRQQFYVLEESPPRVPSEPPRTQLRFLDRTLDGRLRSMCALVWHFRDGLNLEADSWYAGIKQRRYYRSEQAK